MSRREQILQRLQEMGAEPKRSLGQNFLVADHVIEKIVAAARLSPCSQLIEIGPGLGALTEDLLKTDKPFRVVELDRKFVEYWRERGLTVIEGDALALDWTQFQLPARSLLVSNLPYQISSSMVIERSVEPAGLSKMILMFQKEVAQRLVAKARTKDYGLLSVIAQTFWSLRVLLEAGPQDFYPPPKVASRVVVFDSLEGIGHAADPLLASAGERKKFLRLVKAAFAHRRKLLSRNLVEGWCGGDKSRLEWIEENLVSLRQGRQARAEELDPQAFVGLYRLLKETEA